MTESALQLHEIECDEDQTVLPHPHINVGYTLALLKPGRREQIFAKLKTSSLEPSSTFWRQVYIYIQQ